MYESFDPDVTLQRHYAVAVGWAIAANTKAAKEFEDGKTYWIQNAEILQSLSKPLGVRPVPAKVQKAAIVGTEVVTSWGPELVCDPTCELPAPLPPNPADVADVGACQWGGIWAVGPLDTMTPGSVVTHQGHQLRRVASAGFWGGRGWYQEV